MDKLSVAEIEMIGRDVRREDITFSHLLEDLIDHVCCDVEYEMEQGHSFQDAYRKVKEKIGLHGLQNIQADTLYLVDAKYRNMKKTMMITGITGTILLGFAALFKIQHWPGAGIMMTLGAFILAFVFLPSSLSVLYRESKSGKRLILFITAFLAAFFFILGVLFKIQHWPGANIMIMVSVLFAALFLPLLLAKKLGETQEPGKKPVYVLGFLAAYLYLAGVMFKFNHWPAAGILYLTGSILFIGMAFPWYAWLTWRNSEYVHSTFLFLVPVIIWVMLSSGLINLRLSYNYMEGYGREFNRQEALLKYLSDQQKNVTLPAGADTTLRVRMDSLHRQCLSVVEQVQQIKESLAKQFAPESRSEADRMQEAMNNATFFQIDATALSSMSPGRKQLEASVADLGAKAGILFPGDPALVARVKQLISPAVYLPGQGNSSLITAGSSINKLTLLQNAVLLADREMMLAMAGNPSQPSKTQVK